MPLFEDERMKPVKKPRPVMFIGSSSEAKPVVDTIVQVFADHVDCIPWYLAPEFKSKGSFPTFNGLCDAARAYDFALFVLTSDDLLEHRSEKYSCPRDNVVFEMGLFIGTIGPERVFAVVEQHTTPEMKIPTDLYGVNMPRFDHSPDTPIASLASINAELQGFVKTIEKQRFHKIALNLAIGWGFQTPGRHFEVCLGAGPLTDARATIGEQKIAIAARIEDPIVNFEDDNCVAFSESRSLPDPLGDMIFRIPESLFERNVRDGTKIQARVVLVPQGLDLSDFATLKEAVEYGCRIVEPISVRAGKDATA
jgi:hypothetical protein